MMLAIYLAVSVLLTANEVSGEINLYSTQNLENKTVTLTCINTDTTDVLFYRNDEMISKCLSIEGECYPKVSDRQYSTSENTYNITLFFVSFRTCDTYKCSDSNVSSSLTLNISVFNHHEVRSYEEPKDSKSGDVIVTTHCSLPSTKDDFHVEWSGVTGDNKEVALVVQGDITIDSCPFDCNGANASSLITKIPHTDANGTVGAILIHYRVTITHVSSNFTQPLTWTSELAYFVKSEALNLPATTVEDTCGATCIFVIALCLFLLVSIVIVLVVMGRQKQEKRKGILTIEYNDICEINEACDAAKDEEFGGEDLKLAIRESATSGIPTKAIVVSETGNKCDDTSDPLQVNGKENGIIESAKNLEETLTIESSVKVASSNHVEHAIVNEIHPQVSTEEAPGDKDGMHAGENPTKSVVANETTITFKSNEPLLNDTEKIANLEEGTSQKLAQEHTTAEEYGMSNINETHSSTKETSEDTKTNSEVTISIDKVTDIKTDGNQAETEATTSKTDTVNSQSHEQDITSLAVEEPSLVKDNDEIKETADQDHLKLASEQESTPVPKVATSESEAVQSDDLTKQQETSTDAQESKQNEHLDIKQEQSNDSESETLNSPEIVQTKSTDIMKQDAEAKDEQSVKVENTISDENDSENISGTSEVPPCETTMMQVPESVEIETSKCVENAETQSTTEPTDTATSGIAINQDHDSNEGGIITEPENDQTQKSETTEIECNKENATTEDATQDDSNIAPVTTDEQNDAVESAADVTLTADQAIFTEEESGDNDCTVQSDIPNDDTPVIQNTCLETSQPEAGMGANVSCNDNGQSANEQSETNNVALDDCQEERHEEHMETSDQGLAAETVESLCKDESEQEEQNDSVTDTTDTTAVERDPVECQTEQNIEVLAPETCCGIIQNDSNNTKINGNDLELAPESIANTSGNNDRMNEGNSDVKSEKENVSPKEQIPEIIVTDNGNVCDEIEPSKSVNGIDQIGQGGDLEKQEAIE